MITKELENTLSAAVEEAIKRHHEYVTLEHLLFALLTIAAAADLQPVLPRLAAAFTKATGHSVRATYGSSGNFFAQIWLYCGFAIVGTLLGYWIAVVLGRDYRSRSLKAFSELKAARPRRPVR